MSHQVIKFNKSILNALVAEGTPCVIHDSAESGLRFKVGVRRSVFQFEKRIRGRKTSPVTITLGAYPAISIDQARQEARRLASLCEQGIDPRKVDDEGQTASVTLQMAIEKFEECKCRCAPATQKTYQGDIGRIPKHWYSMELQEIKPAMLKTRFQELQDRTQTLGWIFLKFWNNLWNTCAPHFRDGKDQRILKDNPVREAKILIKGHRRKQPKRSVINECLLGRFVITCEKLRSHRNTGVQTAASFALLSLFTGFRRKEALCLKWEYVDLENGIVHLPGVADSNQHFRGTKNGQDHWVPLSSYAWDLLKSLKASAGDSPFVFPRALDPDKPKVLQHRSYRVISKELGSHFSPHVSRRTFASVANEAGLGFLTVKRLLNHRFEGGVTGGYVVHGFNPNREREHFQKICDYILERRATFLGEHRKSEPNTGEALNKLRLYALELGLDLETALQLLTRKDAA